MFMRLKLTTLALVFSLISCTTKSSQNSSKEHSINVDFFINNKDFDLSMISLYKAEISEKNRLSTIKFESLEGGGTYFIGIPLKEFHGDKYGERLTIKCDEKASKTFSVNDILKWKVRKDEKRFIYLAPDFCD